MNKKIISLILLGVVSSSCLISCSEKPSTSSTNSTTSTTSSDSTENDASTTSSDSTEGSTESATANDAAQNSTSPVDAYNASNPTQNTKISQSPTIDVAQVVSISDFKDKNADQIKSVLGDPTSSDGDVSTYKKDGYTFEVKYYDSVCGQVKIIPEAEIKFPVDATISLKAVGITAGDSDEITPQGLVWNNKFDTYRIDVTSDLNVENKLGYIQIILDEKYK